jgi:hypothetical protein
MKGLMSPPPADDPDPPPRAPKARPHTTAEGAAAKAARDARLAAALRENLKRRKAQSRARDDEDR